MLNFRFEEGNVTVEGEEDESDNDKENNNEENGIIKNTKTNKKDIVSIFFCCRAFLST